MSISALSMLAKAPLGRLTKVDDLSTVWASEAKHFTPWLAEKDNITLLGETIGIPDLGVQDTEVEVGPYSADIVCKDAEGAFVVIENQLGKTDHTHLGQLLTYAAGLEAATVVWIARQFTAEHRAALDWLNQITDQRFNFFALEIELWQIGSSAIAPKFNIVSQPNDWSTRVKATTSRKETISDVQQLHLEFWTQLREFMQDRPRPVKLGKPSVNYWSYVGIGTPDIYLRALNAMRDQRSSVQLRIGGPHRAAYYKQLVAMKTQVEQKLDFGALLWEPLPDNKTESHIVRKRVSDPKDRNTWPELNNWFAETLERFDEVFRPIVKGLNPDDDSEAETDTPLDEPEHELEDGGHV